MFVFHFVVKLNFHSDVVLPFIHRTLSSKSHSMSFHTKKKPPNKSIPPGIFKKTVQADGCISTPQPLPLFSLKIDKSTTSPSNQQRQPCPDSQHQVVSHDPDPPHVQYRPNSHQHYNPHSPSPYSHYHPP